MPNLSIVSKNGSKAGIASTLIFSLLMGTIAPFFWLSPSRAQLFPRQDQRQEEGGVERPVERPVERQTQTQRQRHLIPSTPARIRIVEGTTLPTNYTEKEKILMTKEETVPLTIFVEANITDRNGQILIPYGSEITGELQPDGEGVRFVAKEIAIGGDQTLLLDATSELITRTETVDQGTNTGSILQGAGLGAAAATLLSSILGDRAIATEEILGGAGLGALGGLIFGRKKAELISIDPSKDLDVILRSSLQL